MAAISYQESHWNPKAISATGVKGLMMLTQITAKELDVLDRKDPQQSIRGGSEYIQKLHARIPAHIKEPDRTYMALAAYNVGYGHLVDAQQVAVSQGRNANKWADVKWALPLLTDRKYNRYTRHGYARGHEPVGYVANIRNYYELLAKQRN